MINSTYSSLQKSYGPRMINAKETIGEFLSRMHKRELILKDKLKIVVKSKFHVPFRLTNFRLTI